MQWKNLSLLDKSDTLSALRVYLSCSREIQRPRPVEPLKVSSEVGQEHGLSDWKLQPIDQNWVMKIIKSTSVGSLGRIGSPFLIFSTFLISIRCELKTLM
jgi:hypothetical protein